MNLTAPVPPAAAPPVQSPALRASGPSTRSTKVFVAPSRIPPRIASVVDEAPSLPEPGAAGVPNGTGPVSAVLGVLDQLIRLPAPPPPRPTPKAAESAPSRPVAVSSGVQAAKLVRRVIPVYPELAKRARISGTVRLVGVVGKDGTIEHLQLVSGPPLLVQAALGAVSQWLYRPTLLNGVPVEVVAPIDVVFTLN